MKKLIGKLLPQKFWDFYQEKKHQEYRGMNPNDVFTKIYTENKWGGEDGDFYSGDGTTNKNTDRYVSFLAGFVQQYNIRSILDIGCGDFRVMKRVLEQCPDVEFIGADVVKPLVEKNNERYASKKIRFVHIDAISEKLPIADLCTIRQVLQHLDNKQIKKILDKTIKFRHLLVTEHVPEGKGIVPNKNKGIGPDVRLVYKSGVFIDQAPFNLKVDRVFSYKEDFIAPNGNIPANIITYHHQKKQAITNA